MGRKEERPHAEAMKAIQAVKQQERLSKDIVDDIKETHRRFVSANSSEAGSKTQKQKKRVKKPPKPNTSARPSKKTPIIVWSVIAYLVVAGCLAFVLLKKLEILPAEDETIDMPMPAESESPERMTNDFELPVRLVCEGDMINYPIRMDFTIDKQGKINGTYTNVKYNVIFDLSGIQEEDGTLQITGKHRDAVFYFTLMPQGGNSLAGWGQGSLDGEKLEIHLDYEIRKFTSFSNIKSEEVRLHLKRYRNSRFGFAILYPPQFSSIQEATDETSCIFMKDDQTYLTVYADENTWNETLADRFKEEKARHQSITYSRMKNNWFVITDYTEDGRIFYQKTAQIKEAFVTATLYFPPAEKDYYSPIVTEIFNNFPLKE